MEQINATYLSTTGHFVQTLGITAIALLFYMLYRTAPSRYFLYWVIAWLALFFAQVSLSMSFRYPALSFLEFFYFLGEYLFALCLWLGFKVYPRNRPQQLINWYKALPPLILIVGLFTFAFDTSSDDRFRYHSTIFALALIPAFLALTKLRFSSKHKYIKLFTLIAMFLLFVNFLANACTVIESILINSSVALTYYAYQSIIDMMLEMLLAAGLLSISAANMQARLTRINKKLEAERDRMAMLAHRDALTNCYNRHALQALEQRVRDRNGLLVMVDINHLKKINDEHGHQAGDRVIKRVAQTLKACMREHDYLFRYGGDEFLLVAFDFPMEEAQSRLNIVVNLLEKNPTENISVSISWGIYEITPDSNLANGIAAADKLMYKNKTRSR